MAILRLAVMENDGIDEKPRPGRPFFLRALFLQMIGFGLLVIGVGILFMLKSRISNPLYFRGAYAAAIMGFGFYVLGRIMTFIEKK